MNTLHWLAIAGPTACGKSAFALTLAQAMPIEIISVDSALVYRGMDIGTAKPTPDELALAPHHLIDIRDPSHTYSAAEFVRDATQLVHDIRARHRLPVLVGGTMLYFKALFEGLDDMPAAQAHIRQELEHRALALGWPALHAELAQADPITAQRLAPNDGQRIARALEVFMATGQALSAWQRRAARPQTGAATPPTIAGLPGALWSMEPQQRSWLHQRIEQRFDAMLAAGLIEEVQRLRARGDLSLQQPSMRCVGYRQTWEALDASSTEAPHTLLTGAARHALRERGIFATRQLAKRQLTWLRSMPQRQVWPCDEAGITQRMLQQLAQTQLGGPSMGL